MGLIQTLQSRLLRYESTALRDRQAYFSVARNLARAQFLLGDAELSQRLWQDVADRGLDVERIEQLMYGCWFQDDPDAMAEADAAYLSRTAPPESPGIFEHF
ncbi:hypothetical protein SynA1840_01041 [Synechococcus sp. A18-40]|nr:hypothetical protein SynA1840_01041 [Synechococcus sp. A18-40]